MHGMVGGCEGILDGLRVGEGGLVRSRRRGEGDQRWKGGGLGYLKLCQFFFSEVVALTLAAFGPVLGVVAFTSSFCFWAHCCHASGVVVAMSLELGLVFLL